MFKLNVGQAEQYRDISENETRLRVPFQIVDQEGEVIAERIESFPISATLSEVEEVLQRHLTVFTEDWNRYEANKGHQEQLDQSQEVANSISNITIE